jgi:hypothetical protein
MAITITLPTLHSGQVELFEKMTRFTAIVCGRRWGKSMFAVTIIADSLIKGQRVGVFCPQYTYTSELFRELEVVLAPLIKYRSRSHSQELRIELSTGGKVEFWSLNNQNAGRSRKYHLAVVDEAGITDKYFPDVWAKSVRPTLVDYQGRALILGTPKGVSKENFFYQITHDLDNKLQFTVFSAPTYKNPFISSEEMELIVKTNSPEVFRQEFLAEWIDWSGSCFFSKEKCLVNNEPVDFPDKCDYIFAVIDSAVKSGLEHDGTAVTIFAVNKYFGHRLIILDWEILSVDGALLENWIPSVFTRCEDLAKETNARYGFAGVFIEDKVSGTILIQQGRNKGWPVHSIDSKLTAMGKDERAINASSYIFQNLVKISKFAYEKRMVYKNDNDNHLLYQFFGFILGDKNNARRADDLLDTMTYGIMLGCGANTGF